MKFYKLSSIILSALMLLSLTGCGNDKPNVVTPVSASVDEVKITTTAETTAAIPQIDCFEGVEITLSGISPNGKLTIDKENASQDIRKWVSFSSDLSSGIHNGDTVIVTASYDDGTVRYQQTKEIEADLPFYITDISGYDTSSIITAMDESVSSVQEKLKPGETVLSWDVIPNYKLAVGEQWQINNATWNHCADYFYTTESGSNVFVRIYNAKVNATKITENMVTMKGDIISIDGYFHGDTLDFDNYIYASCRRLLDVNGAISIDDTSYKVNNNRVYLTDEFTLREIRPYGSLDDIKAHITEENNSVISLQELN